MQPSSFLVESQLVTAKVLPGFCYRQRRIRNEYLCVQFADNSRLCRDFKIQTKYIVFSIIIQIYYTIQALKYNRKVKTFLNILFFPLEKNDTPTGIFCFIHKLCPHWGV